MNLQKIDMQVEGLQGISADGKYLFFSAVKDGIWDYYWADAKIIEKLKHGSLK